MNLNSEGVIDLMHGKGPICPNAMLLPIHPAHEMHVRVANAVYDAIPRDEDGEPATPELQAVNSAASYGRVTNRMRLYRNVVSVMDGSMPVRGLCDSCYETHWKAGTLDQFPTQRVQRRRAERRMRAHADREPCGEVTAVDELLTFLRATWDARCTQLDEDEQVAREAAEKAPYDEWGAAGARGEDDAALANWEVVRIARPYNRPDARAVAEHIARWDPARVLAEVELERADIEAKRRILDEYERALDRRKQHPDDLASAGALLALLGAVKIVAQPYAGREGWCGEWAT